MIEAHSRNSVYRGPKQGVRPSGISLIGPVSWGTHFCQFYETKQDLIEVLVPYFREGLRNNEFCMWITSAPLQVKEATEALRKAIPNLDDYLNGGQLEILDYSQWYTKSGKFDAGEVMDGWVGKLEDARQRGFDGLRLTGNTHWLEDSDWESFKQYEEAINDVIGDRRVIALCTYSLERCGANEILDVVANHQFALIRRSGSWEIFESASNKKLGEELRATQGRFELIFSSSNEGIALHEIVYNLAGEAEDYRILDVNASFEQLTGIPKSRAMGEVASILYGTGEAPYLSLYSKVAETGEPAHFEAYFEPMEKHFMISVFSPATGQFATQFFDITNQKNLERQLKERAEDLAHSNSQLQQFAYVSSHDLQEPLRMVTSYLGLLERRCGDQLDEKAKEYMEMVIDGANRMRELINDLLEYSRVDGRSKAFIMVDMNLVCSKVKEGLAASLAAAQAELEVSDLPTILGDETQMVQLLQNLVSNAVKFHGELSPIVHISCRKEKKDWVFAVEDNGIGIEPQYQDRVFDMFQRLHTREEYEGTGIGLAIAKKIVERHGGRIWVESDGEHGSTFFFTIPES